MALKLEHILAGKGMRVGKVQTDALINELSLPIPERAVMGVPGFWLKAQHGAGNGHGPGSGHPDNPHPGLARGSGDGGNGVSRWLHLDFPEIEMTKAPQGSLCQVRSTVKSVLLACRFRFDLAGNVPLL